MIRKKKKDALAVAAGSTVVQYRRDVHTGPVIWVVEVLKPGYRWEPHRAYLTKKGAQNKAFMVGRVAAYRRLTDEDA